MCPVLYLQQQVCYSMHCSSCATLPYPQTPNRVSDWGRATHVYLYRRQRALFLAPAPPSICGGSKCDTQRKKTLPQMPPPNTGSSSHSRISVQPPARIDASIHPSLDLLRQQLRNSVIQWLQH